MGDYSLVYDPGLKDHILRVINKAIGRDNAIPRGQLLKIVGGFDYSRHFERTVRAAILDLRRDGHLICSTGGRDGGYWLAKNWDELKEFVTREYHSRAVSMLETESILRKAAQDKWGPEQYELFEIR